MSKNKFTSFLIRHWGKILILLVLVGTADILHYLRWPKSVREFEFNLKGRLDQRKINAYYDSKNKTNLTNPQYALAEEYFEYYLKERPSPPSRAALIQAFIMWGNLKQTSKRVDIALSQIVENDVFPDILNGVTSSYSRDGRFSKKFTEFDLYSRILKKGVGAKTEHFLKFKIAEFHMEQGEYEKALAGFRAIVEKNNGEYYVKHASGNIYEIQNLNVGMRAPVFEGVDIKNRKIGLAKNSAKIRVLFFWATDCGPCHGEFPHLKKIAIDYPAEVQIIGIAGDRSRSDLQRLIDAENLDWPNILEGEAFFGEISRKYNILRYPTIYIIDKNGLIAAKDLRGEGVTQKIKSML